MLIDVSALNEALNIQAPDFIEDVTGTDETSIFDYKKWVANNIERVREIKKRYRDKNKEKLNEKARNSEAKKASEKRRREKNKESIAEYMKEYQQANKEKLRDYHREYYHRRKKLKEARSAAA